MDDAAMSLEQVVDAIRAATIAVAPDGSIRTLNAAAEAMFGHGRDALIGRSVSLLLSTRHAGASDRAWRAPWRPPAGQDGQLVAVRKGGDEFLVAIDARPIGTAPDALLLCSIEDLSARRRAGEAEALFTTLFRASPDVLSLTTLAEGRYLKVNDAFLRVWGREQFEVIGRTSADIGFWVDPALRGIMVENLRRHGFVRGLDAKIRTSTGEQRDFVYSVDLIRFQEQELLLGIGHDITDLLKAEAQARHAQRLETIGKLAGGVAHDFNNLLAIIQGNVELLDESLDDESPLRPLAQDALSATKRGASLTHQLLAYSRQQPLSPKIVKIDELLRETADMLVRTLGETIAIEIDIAAGLWSARVDLNQLANALLNLAVNARDAMPQGGTLMIEASNTVLDRDYCDRNAEVQPGRYVLIALTDSGTGMSPDVLERALEPFFTTKEVGRGSGLGLSMVYGFVRQSGGHLKIDSELDQGTSVRLYLPKADGEGDVPDVAHPLEIAPVSTGNEIVLVVEDDDAVRTLAVRFLRGLGYRTFQAPEAASGDEILDAVPIDLLLTDLVLPGGRDGALFARQAQARHPALRVLYMSGYTRHAIVHDGVLDPGVRLLTKPFLKQEIASAVRECLDGRT